MLSVKFINVKVLFLIVLAFSNFIITSENAESREEIINFSVDIKVDKYQVINVVERIAVRAEENSIIHGIYRELPNYTNFDLVSIKIDNEKSEYYLDKTLKFTRIYIGNRNIKIPSGVYVYEIAYKARDQIALSGSSAELYWNVTGNSWSFPILATTSTVTLPEGSKIRQAKAFTGSWGAAGSDYRYTTNAENKVLFNATRPFNPGEGLTISVIYDR